MGIRNIKVGYVANAERYRLQARKDAWIVSSGENKYKVTTGAFAEESLLKLYNYYMAKLD